LYNVLYLNIYIYIYYICVNKGTYLCFIILCIIYNCCSGIVLVQLGERIVRGRNLTAARQDSMFVRFVTNVPSAHTGGGVRFTTFRRRRRRWSAPTRVQCAWVHPRGQHRFVCAILRVCASERACRMNAS